MDYDHPNKKYRSVLQEKPRRKRIRLSRKPLSTFVRFPQQDSVGSQLLPSQFLENVMLQSPVMGESYLCEDEAAKSASQIVLQS